MDANQRTPLFYAVLNQKINTIKLLFKEDANPFVKDVFGISIEELAKQKDNLEIIAIVRENLSRLGFMIEKDYFKREVLKYHQKAMFGFFMKMPMERQRQKIKTLKLEA